MQVFSVCVLAAVMTATASAAPTVEVDAKSLATPVVPVVSSSQQASSFEKGAQQASSSSGEGSYGYDHGADTSKIFKHKESSGSRESFSHSRNDAFNRGSGYFSNSGAFKENALNRNFLSGVAFPGVSPGLPVATVAITSNVPNAVFGGPGAAFTGAESPSLAASLDVATICGGLPLVGVSSSVESLKKGSPYSGFSEGQGSWHYTQGHSSENSSGNKETFSNKESFGQESSASHAKGASQNSHTQSSGSSAYDKGQQLGSTSQLLG